MKWIRDAIEAAKQVRVVRKEGYTGQLYVYPHEDIERMLREIKWQRKTYQLAYQCIEDMGQRKSRCRYCLEREVCTSKKKGNILGCEDWALKFVEVDDEQAAETENQETGVSGNDQGEETGEPVQERDHNGGPGQGGEGRL
jgi:hypothetical protein